METKILNINIFLLAFVLCLSSEAVVHASQQETVNQNTDQAIDAVIDAWMTTVKSTSASITITRNGKTLYYKTYGFLDRRKKRPTEAFSVFRIGSCTKPITAAAIHALIDQDELSLDTKIYDYLEIEPYQEKLGDDRIEDVTIQQLLDHKGGWDATRSLEPLYELEKIKRKLGIERQPTKEDIVQYMWNEPLQDAPGITRHYSNFGYMLLGMAIEKSTGKNFETAIQTLIFKPMKIEDIQLSNSDKKRRSNREVYYPHDSKLPIKIHDSAAGLTGTTGSLCQFLESYWLDGTRRKSGSTDYYYYQTGSLPYTTSALIEQRLDGINIAVLLNSRRNETYNSDNAVFRGRLNDAIDKMLDEQ